MLASNLATFTRYDGVVLPYSALNLTTGQWPYLLSQTSTSFSVTRGSWAFTQSKVPGATYQYQIDRVKETIVIASAPATPQTTYTITIPFSTSYTVAVQGTTIDLDQGTAGLAWTTTPFAAWDSAGAPTATGESSTLNHAWANAVTSVSYSSGELVLTVDPTVLASAVYPLYIDPTWVVGGSAGWGTSTLTNATFDYGDGSVKIGTFADDFANNLGTGWTVREGTVTFSTAAMHVYSAGWVQSAGHFTDFQFQSSITFNSSSGSNSISLHFCDNGTLITSSCNNGGYYRVVVNVGSPGSLQLKGYTTNIIATYSTTVALATTYTVKIVAQGNYYEVWWNGVRVIALNDPSPPPAGHIRDSGVGYVASLPLTSNTVDVRNVRVWNTTTGTITTPVRDAGTNRPLSTEASGTVDAYDQLHVAVRSGSTSSLSGPFTNVKADVANGIPYNTPDQTRLEFYRLQITLSSGTNSTPILTQVTTTEGTIPTASPTANTGMESWYPYVGGIVNLVNGNLYDTATDLSFQGKGFTLAVVRAYNSALVSQGGPFGLGWTFNYRQNLTVAGNGNVTWNGPDGSSFLFVAKGTSGGYSPPAGVPARLVKNADGTYTLWSPDGGSEAFSSAGLLQTISDRNGNTLTLTYSTGTPPLLLKVADATGKALTFTYDGSNRITQVADPIGRRATYTYSAANTLSTFADPLGNKWQYCYCSTPARLQQIVDPVGKSILAAYDSSGRVTSLTLQDVNTTTLAVLWQFREYAISYNTSTTRAVQDAREYWTTMTLNSFGNGISMSGPAIGCRCDSAGNSSSYTWDGEMNQVSRADGRGDTWTMTYGFRANLLTTTDPGNNVSSRTWLEVNNATNYFVVPESSTTYRGFTTTYTYDGKGNRLSVTDPGGNITRYAYDASGFLNKTVSARGFTTWFTYNASGYLVKREDNLSETTTYAYDAIGLRTSLTDPLGFVTSTTYDADSRVTKTMDPLNDSTTFTYNGRSDRISVTDPDGATTAYAYNVTNDKVSSLTDSGNNVTRYAYDLRGNLNATTDADGHTTYNQYDAFDRVTKVTTPLNFHTAYVYDAAGNRIARTDGNGATTRYAYDKLDRLEDTSYPGAPVYGSPQTLTYAYDQDGNRVSVTGFGYTETFGYDRSDRLASSVFNYGAYSVTTTYTYDQDGNKGTMTLGSARTAYFYDRVERLTGLLDPEGQNTTYGYDKDSRQTRETDPSGVVTTRAYDKASRLTGIWTNTSGGSVLESFTYAYDKAGLRTSETDVQSGTTTTTLYVYDNVHRLYKATQELGRRPPSTTDTYDAVGNLAVELSSATASTETFTVDADNQLTNASFNATSYTAYAYDKDGNRVKTTTSGGATTTYAYDYENRLLSVSGGCTYTYAPTGERVTSACASGTTDLAYDSSSRGGSNLLATYTSSGSQTARYLDANGMNSPVEAYEGGNHYAYQTDALGSVRMLTGGSQNATDAYGYDPWGNVVSQSGTLANPLQFTSSLSANGLDDMRARFYDPTANGGHRFLSQDPGGCASTSRGGYAYARNNPVTTTDPGGRDPSDNIWLPIPCGWSWSCGLQFVHFDLDVFVAKLTYFALIYTINAFPNIAALYYYVSACSWGLVDECIPAIVAAIATGVGWLGVIACLVAWCGILLAWLLAAIGYALNCNC